MKLTSSISLLAFGDVASLNSLIATGILTFSPSGIQSPYQKEVQRVSLIPNRLILTVTYIFYI